MEKKENLTALQQLFSDLEKSQPGLFNVYTVDGRNCINQFFKYLEIEKQQIIDACNQIEFEDTDNFGIADKTTKGEQYYNETYK